MFPQSHVKQHSNKLYHIYIKYDSLQKAFDCKTKDDIDYAYIKVNGIKISTAEMLKSGHKLVKNLLLIPNLLDSIFTFYSPYSEVGKLLFDWHIHSLPQANATEFWQFLFVKHQTQLARYYVSFFFYQFCVISKLN